MATESDQQDADDAESVKKTRKTSHIEVDELPVIVTIFGDECEKLVESTVNYQPDTEDDVAIVKIQSKDQPNILRSAVGLLGLFTFLVVVIILMQYGVGGLAIGIIGGLTVNVMNGIVDISGKIRRFFR